MLSAKQIPPGQSGQIEVALKTEGVGGQTLHKSVTVQTNDPRQPQISLNLTAVVESEFNLSERTIYFGNVPKGKEAVKELIVTIPQSRRVNVTGVESTDQSVAVKLEPLSGEGDRKIKIIAIQKADAKDGYHFGNIILKTSSTLTPELRIPVRGNVTANPGS